MATALGAAPVLATAWLIEPVAAPARTNPVPSPRESSVVPVDPPEIVALLARIASSLEAAGAGLTSGELRAALFASAETLQRALAAGVRTRKLRRVGSHNKLRYLLNA